MKKISVVLMILAVFATACFAADPACGLWKSIDDKSGEVTAIWKIYQEGDTLFGTIAATTDDPQDVIASACKPSYKGFPIAGEVNKMHTVGTPWIFNMKNDGEPGKWSKGNIINPGDGKMYGCKIVYLPNGQKGKTTGPTLGMAGVLMGISVFQYWIPATEADIAAAQAKNPAKN